MAEDSDPKANKAAPEGEAQPAGQPQSTPPGSQVAPSQNPVIPSGDTPAPPEPAPTADKASPSLQQPSVKGEHLPESQPSPQTPEQAAVQANKPGQPVGKKAQAGGKGPAAPKKIGKEKVTRSKARFLVGCAGAFIFLFVLFIVLMVLMISKSGASNPVMQAFGLDPGGIRNFLQGVVGFSFGILAFLFLILAIIRLFKFLGAQKSDKEKRKSSMRMLIVHSTSMVVLILIWTFLANYIGALVIPSERVIAEIVVVSPEDISELQAPVEITFSALNVALALEQADVAIEGMAWDFEGDGIYEVPVVPGQPQVTHLYNQRGTYNVGLEVRIAGQETPEIYTQLIQIETAVFDAEPSTGTAPLQVQFDASTIVSSDNVRSLDWDFDGDGQYDIEGPDNMRPRYTFEQIGSYRVALRVIDKNNNVENYSRVIEITPSDQPILSAQIDASPGFEGMIPFQVRFDGDRSRSLKGTITRYRWDFGDGSELQVGKNVSHVYSDPGFYSVTLTVMDSLGNEAQANVEIEAQSSSSVPEAVIITLPAAQEDMPLTGQLPFKVEFDASQSLDADDDIVQFEWDFDGDEISDAQGEKVTHTFDELGTFEVTLSVADAEGQSGEASMTVVVEEPDVLASFVADPEEGTAPLTVQFDGSSSSAYESNIVSYEWDFGDGSPKTITGAIVSHKYNDVGTYVARLKVLTNNNESASSSVSIFVREIPLKACFTPSRTSGLAPLTVAFDSKCSTGAVTGYHWAFGDGDESASRSPTHTFDFPGNYTVTLEVTDDKNNVSTYEEIITAEGQLQ